MEIERERERKRERERERLIPYTQLLFEHVWSQPWIFEYMFFVKTSIFRLRMSSCSHTM